MPKFISTRVQRIDLIRVINGEEKADFILKNVNLVNVHTEEVYQAIIAIKGERIAFIGEKISDFSKSIGEKTRVISLEGKYAVPGLIDPHIHIESSMITPTQFAKAVLPLGTTTIITDFHEILWTLGKTGLKLLLEEASNTPLKVFLAVPSTPNDALTTILTPGFVFTFDDLKEMMTWDFAVALGEISRLTQPEFYRLAEAAMMHKLSIEGHIAGVKDIKKIVSYFAAGASSDHEATDIEDALNRLRVGVHLMIREGSAARDLKNLIKIVTEKRLPTRFCSFCSDDRTPSDILSEGHINYIIQQAINEGVDPISAIQMATINPAIYFGLDREIGSLVPGKIADILIIDNLEKFKISKVIANGQIVAENGRLIIDLEQSKYPDWAIKTFRLKRKLTPDDFQINVKISNGIAECNIISVKDGSLISKRVIEKLVVKDHKITADSEKGIAKIACIERFGKTDLNIGLGFIKGFGIKNGAFGCSIAHDTHNLLVIGTNDRDMALVANHISELNGGIAVASNNQILSSLSLPLGGIISLENVENVASKLEKIEKDIRDKLGSTFKSPIMTLSFQACPSIPELKISDKGLIDVEKQRIVPLIINLISEE
ncbi:MAG: adenine deaminase [Candidatus Asgardarchaeum sp.]